MHASLSSLSHALAVPRHSFISSFHVAVSYDERGVRRERVTVDIDVLPSLTPRRLLLPSSPPSPPLVTARPSTPPLYSIRVLFPITPLHGQAASPSCKEPPSTSASIKPPSPIGDVDMSPSPLPSCPSSLPPLPPSTPPVLALCNLSSSPPAPAASPSPPPPPSAASSPPAAVSTVQSVSSPPADAVPSSSPSPHASHPLPSVVPSALSGSKRALSSSDEDGEERKSESDGSATDEAPSPCAPQGKLSKEEKKREKRRKRKQRKRAENGSAQWSEGDFYNEVDILSSLHHGYLNYSGHYPGRLK